MGNQDMSIPVQIPVSEGKSVILTGSARLAGVIGWPISHSKSPALHGYWIKKYGLDAAYVPMKVAPEDLKTALDGLRAVGFRGVNVTIPHKENAAMLCDVLSDRAKAVSAANTLLFREDGSLYGDNTDGIGFLENIRQHAPSWRAEDGSITVLGAGGAARGIIDALMRDGATQLTIANRTLSRVESLIADLSVTASDFGCRLNLCALADLDKDAGVFEQTKLLINTTSAGMGSKFGDDVALSFSLKALPKDALVTDIVYTPLETPLLRQARAQGLLCIDGLGMLLHQAVPGFYSWFGVKPDVDQDLRSHILALQE